MLNLGCHLIWIDCMVVNKVNFFTLLWMSNDESMYSPANADTVKQRTSKPPSYMIFYDLNTAQIAHMHREFTLKNWSLDHIESYVKIVKPKAQPGKDARKSTKSGAKSKQPHAQTTSANKTSSSSQQQPTQAKSYEEIFYICQFKCLHDSAPKLINKLHHSVTDLKFNECFRDLVTHDKLKQNYIPIKVSQILINVNTQANKHFYYTALYRPVQYVKSYQEETVEYQKMDEYLKTTSLYCVKNSLSDEEFYKLWEDFTGKSWKLIDMKAYKDEKNITKFSAIWTPLADFYEGSSKLFIGLNKNELLTKVNEMNMKGLYPKFLTNYGYLNSLGEHVYCIFFCQF